MRVAVAGASGFIGRRIAAKLRERGDEVVPVSLRPGHALIPATFKDVAAVINLAGEPVAQRWTAEVKRRIRESRVQGTHKLVAAMVRGDPAPKVLVNASATGFYGDRGDEVLSESSAAGSDYLAAVTLAWEEAAMKAALLGVRVVTMRTGIVLGPNGGALAKMLAPFRAGVGGRIGSGRQWMPWIHIDDVAGLFMHAIDGESVSGPLNATAPEPVRNAEFTKELASVLHRPAVLMVPKFALRLIYGEMADAIAGSQRVLPEGARRTGYVFRFERLRPALEEILNAQAKAPAPPPE